MKTAGAFSLPPKKSSKPPPALTGLPGYFCPAKPAKWQSTRKNRMKIAIIRQQDFGKSVLEAFLARGDEVAGVFCAPEKEGAKPDALRVAAQEKGLRLFQFPSLKDGKARDTMKALDVDLGIIACVLPCAPHDYVNMPTH